MKPFALLPDLHFNTEKIADPAAFARTRHAASWLYLNGEAFASMEGGMSFALYSGLESGVDPDEVLAAADRDQAPFCKFPELRTWLRDSMEALRREGR